MDALHAVGRYVLPDGGGVWGNIEHPPTWLFVAGGTWCQRIERSHGPDHRVDDDGAAAGDAERAGEEAERISIAQLDRTEREEAALFELAARRPPTGAAALQAEHAPRVVPREIGEVGQLDQRDRDP